MEKLAFQLEESRGWAAQTAEKKCSKRGNSKYIDPEAAQCLECQDKGGQNDRSGRSKEARERSHRTLAEHFPFASPDPVFSLLCHALCPGREMCMDYINRLLGLSPSSGAQPMWVPDRRCKGWGMPGSGHLFPWLLPCWVAAQWLYPFTKGHSFCQAAPSKLLPGAPLTG